MYSILNGPEAWTLYKNLPLLFLHLHDGESVLALAAAGPDEKGPLHLVLQHLDGRAAVALHEPCALVLVGGVCLRDGRHRLHVH